MVSILVRHKVEDYTAWREYFDSALDFRKQSGEESFQLFRSADDPNEVWALVKWESLEKAKAFLDSDELKTKMKESGVTEKPDIYFLDEA